MPVLTRSHSTNENSPDRQQRELNIAAKSTLNLEDLMAELKKNAADSNKKLKQL